MTLHPSDLQGRKDCILGIAVEEYIRSHYPVSSNFIAKSYLLDLSPATIRNILSELEETGFLTHPHTSAGRIPTQKGYRYYVDNLMDEIKLLEEEKHRIKEEYEREKLALEFLLDKTSEVISEVTHYTGIVSIDEWPEKLFYKGASCVVNYPDAQDLNKIRGILTILEEKEALLRFLNQKLAKKIEIFIGQEIPCQEIDSCSMVISSYKLKEGLSGKLAVLGPTRMDYERVVSALEYCSGLMEELF